MEFLRQESHTGYSDLEGMALELVKTADAVWLRQLSTWILYGKLSNSGFEDFFIQPQPVNQDATGLSLQQFRLQTDFMPSFVSPSTASSVLFIGQSLHQIRVGGQPTSIKSFTADPTMKLLPAHLEYLETINLPISPSSFTNVIASIRLSMSQNALSHLLPLPKVLEILHVLQDFLLLGRGEFAMSLISKADKRVLSRHSGHDTLLPVRKAGRLDELKTQDGDLATVLNQTWAELVALQKQGDLLDDTLDRGRELLRIVSKRPEAITDAIPAGFSSLLFPSPTSLTLSLPPSSPLAIFLTREDISSYEEMNSYLIGIRRAEIRLASLWKHSHLRRYHPSPIGPSISSTAAGKRRLAEKREREDSREKKMRRYWATASKSQFVISELGGYFQGEIVGGHWQHFLSWLILLHGNDAGSVAETSKLDTSASKGARVSRPGTEACPDRFEASPASNAFRRRSASNQQPTQSDPATIAKAHQRYLSALRSSLLMNVPKFTKLLLDTLKLLDHFVALFARLQTVQQNLDLEIDDGVVDALVNHRSDENEVLQEMERSRKTIEDQLDGLVKELRDSVDQSNAEGSWDDVRHHLYELDLGTKLYTPWRPRNINGLLMKLEFIGAKAQIEATNDEHEDETYYPE